MADLDDIEDLAIPADGAGGPRGLPPQVYLARRPPTPPAASCGDGCGCDDASSDASGGCGCGDGCGDGGHSHGRADGGGGPPHCHESGTGEDPPPGSAGVDGPEDCSAPPHAEVLAGQPRGTGQRGGGPRARAAAAAKAAAGAGDGSGAPVGVVVDGGGVPGTQRVWLKTFGCAHNTSDSEYMAGQVSFFELKPIFCLKNIMPTVTPVPTEGRSAPVFWATPHLDGARRPQPLFHTELSV